MKVKIKTQNEILSMYNKKFFQTEGSACVDLRSNLQDILIKPNEVVKFPTGIKMEIENGYCLEIHSRSGLAINNGILVANNVGIVDSDYRGEVIVALKNTSNVEYLVKKGDRIAQGKFTKYEVPTFEFVDELGETERGEGGFGSTGKF